MGRRIDETGARGGTGGMTGMTGTLEWKSIAPGLHCSNGQTETSDAVRVMCKTHELMRELGRRRRAPSVRRRPLLGSSGAAAETAL